MSPTEIWVSGLFAGVYLGIPLGAFLAYVGIPRFLDAVYAWMHRDRH